MVPVHPPLGAKDSGGASERMGATPAWLRTSGGRPPGGNGRFSGVPNALSFIITGVLEFDRGIFMALSARVYYMAAQSLCWAPIRFPQAYGL